MKRTSLAILLLLVASLSYSQSNLEHKTYDTESIYYLPKNFDIEIDSVSIYFSAKDTSLQEFFPDALNVCDITFPRIKYANNTYVEGKIKKLIEDFFSSRRIDINDLSQSRLSGQITCSFEVTYKINNLLGIKFSIYEYGTGAAHGNSSEETLNINLRDGNQFYYRDIFLGSSSGVVKQIILNKINNHDCNCIDKDVDFANRADRDFYFSYDEINIIFHKYEIACGVCGPIEIKLSYKEIEKHVNPNGPLAFL